MIKRAFALNFVSNSRQRPRRIAPVHSILSANAECLNDEQANKKKTHVSIEDKMARRQDEK